ncbi:MAG: hypothetical protein DHS20C18_00100 [Saprospiraceae bacterium]|nr:MAG: hypothetical protein DHS20C18_00100 [Saprospiraceae bacterium]
MTPDFTKDDLVGWIASGKENQVMEALLTIAKYQQKDVQSLIFLTSNKYRKLRQNMSLGSISRENSSIISAEINQNLLEIIDQVRLEEITEKEVKKQIRREKRQKSLWPLVMSAGFLLAMVVAILFIQGRLGLNKTPAPENYLNSWAGTWEQNVEIGPDTHVDGIVTFEIQENEVVGMSESKFPNGIAVKNRLYNIVFSKNGKVLKGKWKYEEVLNVTEGNFEVTLGKDKNNFSGTYFGMDNPDEAYKWTGKRKD